MDTLIKLSNLVTIGNIGTIITIGGFIIYGYWKLKRYWFDQQQAFKNYVAEQTRLQTIQVQQMLEQHTSHLENCIHNIPGHPESSRPSPTPNKPDSSQNNNNN